MHLRFAVLLLSSFAAASVVAQETYVCQVKQIWQWSKTGALEPDILTQLWLDDTFIIDRMTGEIESPDFPMRNNKLKVYHKGSTRNHFMALSVTPGENGTEDEPAMPDAAMLQVVEFEKGEDKPFVLTDTIAGGRVTTGICKASSQVVPTRKSE